MTALIVGIITAVALLALNWRAFQSDAAAAGHGRKQMVRMALIWIAIFGGLTVLFGLFQP